VWRVRDALLEGERALVAAKRPEETVTLKDFNTVESQPTLLTDGRTIPKRMKNLGHIDRSGLQNTTRRRFPMAKACVTLPGC
jgi:hypothetical protein